MGWRAESNTQNFNRYGYVLNNPLVIGDPSGEFFVTALIGAAIGLITNGVSNAINGRSFFEGAGKAALYGAIGGAASFGIGKLAQGIKPVLTAAGKSVVSSSFNVARSAFQTVAHAFLGGTLSE